MSTGRLFYIALILTSIGVAVGIHSMLRRSLREILGNLVRVDGLAAFYERILLLGLSLTCLGWALDASFEPGEETPTFMDYLWNYADSLGDVLVYATMYFGAFAILVTVL